MSGKVAIKCVAVGDGAVGKTCLLYVFGKKVFPEEYVPTVFDNFVSEVQYDGKTIELGLWDTAGQEDYDRIRPLSYPGANIIIFCFSLADSVTLENIKTKWLPEINHHLPNAPKVLVGNKKDMRDSSKNKVTQQDGEQFAKENKFSAYCECSAKTNDGLKEVFDTAIKVVLDEKNKKPVGQSGKKGCLII